MTQKGRCLNTIVKRLSLTLGLFALLGWGTLARSAEAIELRYRADGKARKYKGLSEEVSTRFGKQSPKGSKLEVRIESLFEEVLAPVKGGLLFRVTKELDRAAYFNKKKLRLFKKPGEDLAQKRIQTEFLDPRGIRPKKQVTRSPGEELYLAFPKDGVKPGATWRRRLEPGKHFQLPVDVHYKFEGIREVQGRACAVVVQTAKCKGVEPKTGTDFRFHSRARIAFDVDQGILVRRDVNAEVWHHYKPARDGLSKVRKSTKKSLRLVDGS